LPKYYLFFLTPSFVAFLLRQVHQQLSWPISDFQPLPELALPISPGPLVMLMLGIAQLPFSETQSFMTGVLS